MLEISNYYLNLILDKVKKPSFKNEFIRCQFGISSVKGRIREAKNEKYLFRERARAQIKRRRNVSEFKMLLISLTL